MSLEQIVLNFGYPAIFVITFLEGETILLIGGFLAFGGYLELPWVMLVAFGGAMSGDQLYYYIGRLYGEKLFEKRPKWRPKTERAFHLLRRYQVGTILGFRFLYGIRIVMPFAIGASGILPLRYFLLNLTGAAIWAISFGMAGYLLADTLEILLQGIAHYERWVLVGIIGIAVLVWFYYRWSDKRRAKIKADPEI